MKLALILLLIFVLDETLANKESSVNKPQQVRSVSRHRRSIWQFAMLIQCVEQKSSFLPTWAYSMYNDYGCHCGYGGHGDPIDKIDQCCLDHDNCYATLRRNHSNLSRLNIYFKSYKYSCEFGSITCDDQVESKRDLCACDAEAARCFADSRNFYNEVYRGIYDQGRCFFGNQMYLD